MLKRVLPFVLTLAVGLLLGGFANSLNLFRQEKTSANYSPRTYRRGGCGSSSARHGFDRTPVVVRFKPYARYTEEAMRHGVTGTVRLRVLFGADGSVVDVMPLSTLPYGLTAEAMSAAKGIQFTPATMYGEPYSEWKDIDFGFGQ